MEVAMLENIAHGNVPEFGAIFMANSVTRKECLQRRLFGLPSKLGHFVKQIKAGMILFLFDFETRLLHGVFQASSDGTMNIVPPAYSSSGRQFPAQVRFSEIWRCKPLSEDQFRNAIKENYFSARKFKFGLSEGQVRRLLSLFSLTKCNDQHRRRQLSRGSVECTSDYFIDEGRSVDNDDEFKLSRRLKGKRKVDEDKVKIIQESVSLPHHNLGNITSTENLVHYSHMDNRDLTNDSDFQSSAQIMRPGLYSMPVCPENIRTMPSETQCQRNLSHFEPSLRSLPSREFGNDGSLSFLNADKYQPSLYSQSDYMTSMAFKTTVFPENSSTIPSDTRCQITPPCSKPNLYSFPLKGSENDESCRFIDRSQYQPSLYSQSEYMTSTPLQTAVYSENGISRPFETQSQRDLSCSDPNLHSLSAKEFDNEGSLRFIDSSPHPYWERSYNYSPAFSGQEKIISRRTNTKENYLFDSVKVSGLTPDKQTSSPHGPESYGNSESLHFDRKGRNSVFSRLGSPRDASLQESYDCTDHEKYFSESSIDEVMSVVQRYHRQWEKTKNKVPNQGFKHGGNFMKKRQPKSSLSSHSNSLEISDEMTMNTEDNLAGSGNQIAIGTPFVDFKRRTKTSKVESDTLVGPDLNIESNQLSSGLQKRRKLIRPSFAKYELSDRDVIVNSNVSSNLQYSREIQISVERAVSNQPIEINENVKLPQSVDLPESPSGVVQNEDKDIGNERVEREICCKDGKETLNNTSVPNTTTSSPECDLNGRFSTTLNGRMPDGCPRNLDESGLSNPQELLLESSQVKAGNSIEMVDKDDSKCDEKEFVAAAVDEPPSGRSLKKFPARRTKKQAR